MRISLIINILISLYSYVTCVTGVKTIETNKSTTQFKTLRIFKLRVHTLYCILTTQIDLCMYWITDPN